MTAPPSEFSGTVDELVDEFVIPNLPSMDRLVEWTEVLLRYAYEDPDPILVVRGPSKGHLHRTNGSLIVHSDNAPAIWCFLHCFDQSTDPHDVPKCIYDGRIPVLMALTANKRQGWNYGQRMSSAEKNRLWGLKMKHCHLLPLGEPGLSPRQRFVRNLCPFNHFLFATPKKYDMQRVGWSERKNVADLGESESVIAWIQQRLIHLLGKHGLAIYGRFLDLAGGTRLHMASSGLRVYLACHDDSRLAARNSDGVDRATSDLLSFPARKKLAKGNWTLNEKQGFYLRTGLKSSAIDFSLRYKTLTGQTTAVGKYSLDLESLSESGVVTRRPIEGGTVYDVRIVRERDGSFWLRGLNDALDLETVARYSV